MVHWKMCVPKGMPVIEVVGDKEFVIVAVPESKVHTPVPTVGVLAAIIAFGDEIQMV